MSKRLLIMGVILCLTSMVQAQDNSKLQRAEQLFQWILTDRADSLYAYCSESRKGQVRVAQLKGVLANLEQQAGKYQSHTAWGSSENNYYSDVTFERGGFRLTIVFDAEGKWTVLWFGKMPEITLLSNPQESDKWRERALTIENGNISLPAILTVPKHVARPAVVVLVHGSGPNDKDETIGPNKPFQEIAWGLAERGIASLRYDKRTKVYQDPSLSDNVDKEVIDDALEAIRLVRSLSDVNTGQVFLLGHSLGGMLAPLIAQRSGDLAGIVLVAAPARHLIDVIEEQFEYIMSLSAPDEAAQKAVAALRRQVANARALGTPAYVDSIGLPLGMPKAMAAFDLQYSSADVARQLKIPMLIVQGGRDYQVTMTDFDLWRKALKGKRNVTMKAYPNLNHLLHTGDGKATPTEYERSGIVSKQVLQDIAEWIDSIQY